jgi:hypothetical protein
MNNRLWKNGIAGMASAYSKNRKTPRSQEIAGAGRDREK